MQAKIKWLARAALTVVPMLSVWGPAAQAADVGVSVAISQPGVYGRIDIGRFPQPQLVAPQAVVVGPRLSPQAQYLWVPPGHRRHWARHCRAYGACGVPVYFVRDDWYRQQVMVPVIPPRGAGRGDDRGHGAHGGREGEGGGHGREERHGGHGHGRHD